MTGGVLRGKLEVNATDTVIVAPGQWEEPIRAELFGIDRLEQHAAIWSVAAFAMLGEGDKAADLFNLLNPIHHTSRRAAVHRYKVEPYAVPADVYSQPPHVGRGGWTWYTGAAGWLYRAGLEWILGLRKRGSALYIDPCIPKGWKNFEITYRHGDTVYQITVENPDGVCRGVSRVSLDKTPLPGDGPVPLSDDGREHRVEVVLG